MGRAAREPVGEAEALETRGLGILPAEPEAVSGEGTAGQPGHQLTVGVECSSLV